MKREQIARRMMRRLCAFPSFRPANNPETAEAYVEGISKLLEQFGSESVYEAITSAIDAGGPFAPSVGDLKLFVKSQPKEQPAILTAIGNGEEVFGVLNDPERQRQIEEFIADYGKCSAVESSVEAVKVFD